MQKTQVRLVVMCDLVFAFKGGKLALKIGSSRRVRMAQTASCRRKVAMRAVATQEPDGDFLSEGFGDRQILSAG